MFDFIYSSNPKDTDSNNHALKVSHINKNHKTRQFFGDWGCLSIIGKTYPGYEPVESSNHILIVLGGPLPRKAINIADGSSRNDGTSWILEKWVTDQNIHWEEDLVGHFAVVLIQKHKHVIKIITDINNFVQIFISNGNNSPMRISSHPDALAVASGKLMDIDLISLGDFLKYKTVTFPYTFYRGITQLDPASEHTIEDDKISSNFYWNPKQEGVLTSFEETSELLRNILIGNIKRICANQKSVGVLLSGGEDSRVIASIAAAETSVKAVTFSSSLNRETRLASKIAKKVGIHWHPVYRKPNHYLNHFDTSIMLSSSHNQFIHAHSNGLEQQLPQNSRILGGLMADAFLKCAIHYSRYKEIGKYIFNNNLSWENRKVFIRYPFSNNIDSLIEERRAQYMRQLSEEFPKTHLEWYWLRPSSMTSSMTNLTVNRRLFASYEPFIDSKLFRLASTIPQEWKLNDKIFNYAFKPILNETRYIFHTEGWLPYYKYNYCNISLMLLAKAIWKLGDLLTIAGGSKVQNRHSWPVWKEVVASEEFKQKSQYLLAQASESLFYIQPLNLHSRIHNGLHVEKMNVLQLITWLNWIKKQKDG